MDAFGLVGGFLPGSHFSMVWKTGLPVRSAVLKPHAGGLVVGWVTTSESLLFRWARSEHELLPFAREDSSRRLSISAPKGKPIGAKVEVFGFYAIDSQSRVQSRP
ncbi:hypothetical protein BO72DRAFT_456406 [Aspergillus fijiensis CBS 313.89]|uniref:Uncharacterized protein n=1 Tax=Aspergillus fijiensis CBS 313.89 TaxID=1448319 RepID=A0A8G1RWQ4_9EURO|nr:uncharacterized protein BO72DRAFT_456406 [Aspergillus fijiensis CBS 313.89]RAK80142.1 hypothetical protein BO72DRAFT_456406 [Aspergillus fijiensis CBS 313.89]